MPWMPLFLLWMLAGGKLGGGAVPTWPTRKSPPPSSPRPAAKKLAAVKPHAAPAAQAKPHAHAPPAKLHHK